MLVERRTIAWAAAACVGVGLAWSRRRRPRKVLAEMASGVRLFQATREDVPSILQLIKDLAAYEKEPHAVEIDEATLLRDGFGRRPLFEAVVARDARGGAVGFALYFTSYSTWQGACVYLEDLYVAEASRGRGVGSLLLKAVCQIAHDRGCARFTWQALDWNTPALDFYRSVGARRLDEWVNLRMGRDEMRAFLEGRVAR